MRKLNLSDAFKVAKILKSAEIKEEISRFASKFKGKTDKNLDVNEVGFEFILTLISAAGNPMVEDQIYELLANIKGVTKEDIKNLPLNDFKNDVIDIIKENDLSSFLKSASGLM